MNSKIVLKMRSLLQHHLLKKSFPQFKTFILMKKLFIKLNSKELLMTFHLNRKFLLVIITPRDFITALEDLSRNLIQDNCLYQDHIRTYFDIMKL